MRQAMKKLDKAQKTQIRKKELTASQYETWWGNVQSGTTAVAASPMTEQACAKSLSQLDSMIADEEDKITELEKQEPTKPDQSDQLLSE